MYIRCSPRVSRALIVRSMYVASVLIALSHARNDKTQSCIDAKLSTPTDYVGTGRQIFFDAIKHRLIS